MIQLAAAGFIARTLTVTLRSNDRIQALERLGDLPFLSIVVPARNEERQIETCVRSLLAQRYPEFEVIVIDDRSTDRTAEIVNAIASGDSRLRVVRGEPLPEGWIGKPWALAQGARRARGKWLLFTDADTQHEPLACASALRYAQARDVSFLSLLPTQRFEGAAERILLPTILWMIAFGIGSLDAINDPKRLDAAIFNGQYLLCERSAFETIGGHERVRASIAEDYDLARIVKRDGRFPSMLVDAGDLVYTRMYRSLREIWDGFSKNLYIGIQGDPARAAGSLLALAAISPLPEIALVRSLLKRRYKTAFAMAACIAGTAAAAELAMRRSRFPRGSGAWFPIGAAAMLAIFANSAFQHGTGRVRWRGRRYSSRVGSPEGRTRAGTAKTPGPLWKRPGNR
ncbi:MAG TPA: glycosyltransferase family 2 protein [Candidatus Baltobacteraceae bacterium]|nr:glycosyltransferase family 2 protein [Candidatus Baltobacteraceae bacterium]